MNLEDWDRQEKSMHFDLALKVTPIRPFLDPTVYERKALSTKE